MRNSNSSDISISLSLNSRSFQIQDIEKVNLTVTGSGMRTINRETTSNTVYVKVEYGLNRTFQIDIRLANGDEYTGSTTVNVNSLTKSVPIKLTIDESGFDFDIIIPNNQIAVDKSGKDIAIEGDTLYLSTWDSNPSDSGAGVYIYNISNRDIPKKTSLAPLYYDALGVDVDNNYLYVTNGMSNLRIFDVSDLTSPLLLDSEHTNDGSVPETMNLSNDASTLKTIKSGNFTYLLSYATDFFSGEFTEGATFFQFDVTDPKNPDKAISYSVGEAMPKSFCVDDNYSYVVGRHLDIFDINNQLSQRLSHTTFDLLADETAYDIVKKGDYLYILCSSKLIVFDVSNPEDPVLKLTYDLGGEAINDGCPTPGKALSIYGNYLYIADGNAGIVILDISNPSDPAFKDSIDAVGVEYFRDVYFYDSHLYAVVETVANSVSLLYSYTLE